MYWKGQIVEFSDLMDAIFRDYDFDLKKAYELDTDEMRNMRRQIESGVLFDEKEMTLVIYKAVRDAISDKKDCNYRRIRKDIKDLEKEIEKNPPKNPEPPKQLEPPTQPELPQPEPPIKQPEKKPLVYSGGMRGYVRENGFGMSPHAPSDFTVESAEHGKTLKIALQHSAVPGGYTFELDPLTATFDLGGFHQGWITKLGDNSAKVWAGSWFSVNPERDFYNFYLRSTPTSSLGGEGAVAGYAGQRFTEATKLPTSGISTYRMDSFGLYSISTINTYVGSTGFMTLNVDWKSGKVSGFRSDDVTLAELFIGDINRDTLEIKGNYVSISSVRFIFYQPCAKLELVRFSSDSRVSTI